MYNIRNITKMDPSVMSQLENEIFDACRANEKRETRGRVSFIALPCGDHSAMVRDSKSMVLLTATVDRFDC